MTLVDDIKTRIDIVDLVGETVSLRRSGRTLKALCPYHTERTPSFIVDPSRQTWHCFGACDEGGDIFSWVMKQENVEFRQALALLAERAGLRLTPLDARAEEQNKR
ncbi:MAG: CHC2 zinc finger domain-containing protein, partial [Dehalococcoidia bacterium]